MSKTTMTWTILAITLIAATMAFVPEVVLSHCQVPCGIYDDPARIASLREDSRTIEKAITNITELTNATDAQGKNQLVRWISNKETHASYIITTMSEYFFAQRIKPVEAGADGYDAYLEKLARHHAVIIAAMQCKQHADQEYVTKLNAAIDGIAGYYTE